MRTLENLFSKKNEIEIQSITYGLNLFIPTFILILSSLFENYELTAELGIIIGINIILTQIFSSNARSLIISKKTKIPIQSFILFRILISGFILLLNLAIIYYYKLSFTHLLIQISILIVIQWLNELILTYFEIKKKLRETYFYLYLETIFLIILFISLFFFQGLFYILAIFNLFLFIFFLNYFYKIKKNILVKIDYIKLIKLSLSSLSFFSSFSISFANLLWRLFIIIFCGKIYAGIYFAGFAIGSLPGTFFNNTFGPSMIKKNIKFKKIKQILNYSFLILMIILFLYLVKINKNIFEKNFDTQIMCTFVSLIGSFFMVKGLYFRQYLIQKSNYQSNVFKLDIFYSTLVALVVPILFFIGGFKLVIISFLISSIISFVIYGLIYKLLYK